MEKKELLRQVGSMQQLMHVRPVAYEEGRARGMKAFQVKNGLLGFTVMADKCLDIAEASFCGHNISFLAKPGLMGRNHYDTNGLEAQRSIMGGWSLPAGLKISVPLAAWTGKTIPCMAGYAQPRQSMSAPTPAGRGKNMSPQLLGRCGKPSCLGKT